MSTDKHVTKRTPTTKEETSSKPNIKERTKNTTKQSREPSKTTTKTKPTPKSSEENEIQKSTARKPLVTNTRKPTLQKNAAKLTSDTKTTSSSKKSVVHQTKSNATSSQPSSSRVKKSQYFPSKFLYSNALKSEEIQSKLLDTKIDITRKSVDKSLPKTHTNKVRHPKSKEEQPKPNKVSVRDSSPDTSSTTDRPRTATLRKGSIVNDNIVGPEAPKPIIPVINEAKSPANSDEEKYEDDFESYESDFEAESSVEDTSINIAVVSGDTSSVTTSSAEDISGKQPDIATRDNKILVSSASTDGGDRKLDSGTFELSDFKHRQILRYIEDAVKKEEAILEQDHLKTASFSDEGFEEQKSLQFINFADAKKKCEKRRASAARKKRGDELLSMIKLDEISFTIFDLPSVPYDEYILSYGRTNSVQTSVQTGEDDLSEEVQTEAIMCCNKWTQMPSRFSDFESTKDDFWSRYKLEYLGVGQEEDQERKISNANLLEVEDSRLDRFMRHSGKIMLSTLSEQSVNINIEKAVKNEGKLPFSKGHTQLNTSVDYLQNTSVEAIAIHPKNPRKILTIHTTQDNFKSKICLWDLEDINMPRSVLFSFGEVCCCAYSLENDNHILGGQKDGSVLVWNTEARFMASQSPSFITPLGSGHVSKIVAVVSLDQNPSDLSENNEICTLDESGIIILWTLYSDDRHDGDAILINTQVINLPNIYPDVPDLLCSDCIVLDNHIYVASNYGFILHYPIKASQTGNKRFVPESAVDAMCLEGCPFSSSCFVAGYSNGDISLFSRTTERPLVVLQNKEEILSAGVHILQWSKANPFIFFAKDLANTMHVWNLCKSDMFPEYSIPFREEISCLKISAMLSAGRKDTTYMLIGTATGKIYLHLLNEEYGQESREKYYEDVKIFLDYVNRL